ncbi:MAG: hypothetical protein M0Z60_10100 [Nitrospiraceae bacterium]|nr:hypothetical protein [Nitrospiraceae bacterium]
MYIKKRDFSYLETLARSLDEGQRKRFLEILPKAGGKRSGEDIKKIDVVGDEIFDVQGIGPGQFITRTIIKKAFKEAKGR